MEKTAIAAAQLLQQALQAFEGGESRKAIMLLNAAEAEIELVRDARTWLALDGKAQHLHAKYILDINLKGE